MKLKRESLYGGDKSDDFDEQYDRFLKDQLNYIARMLDSYEKAVKAYDSGNRVIIGTVFIKAWGRYKVIFFAEDMPPKEGIYYIGFYKNTKGNWERDYDLIGWIPDIEAELKRKDEYIWQKALRKLWADPVFQLMKDVLFV